MIDVVDQEIEIEKEGFQEIKIVIEATGMEMEVEVDHHEDHQGKIQGVMQKGSIWNDNVGLCLLGISV